MFINYCVFPYNFGIFLNSSSSAASLVFYLPYVCTHTDTEETEKGKCPEYFKIFEKNTIFDEHPVHGLYTFMIRMTNGNCLSTIKLLYA